MVFANSFSLKQLIKSTHRFIWILLLAETKHSSAILETFFYSFFLFLLFRRFAATQTKNYSFYWFCFKLFFFFFQLWFFAASLQVLQFWYQFMTELKRKKANLNAADIIISNGSYLARDIINQFRCLSKCIIKFFLSFGHYFPLLSLAPASLVTKTLIDDLIPVL